MPELFLDTIPTGSKSSSKPDSTQLSQRFGIGERRVRRIIANLRESGNVILTDHGYFIPDTDDEADREKLEKIYHREKSRAISIFKSLKSARKLIGKVEGDEAMKDMERIAEELNGTQQSKQGKK